MKPARGPEAAKYAITTFSSIRDRVPKPVECTWPDVARALTRFAVATAKDEVPCWSAASYPMGSTRSAANVLALSMLVLDVDDGTPLEQVLGAFPGATAAWHTSWSHEPDFPRYRVVLPLAEPVPVALWPGVFRWAQDRVSGHLDPSTKDASRLWYRPAVRSSEWPHEAGVVSDGADPLSIDLGALQPARPEPVTRRPVTPQWLHPGSSAGAIRRAVQERLNGDPDSRRRLGLALNGQIRGEALNGRAVGIRCPQCTRSSVWFSLIPKAWVVGRCNHRNSCGWTGWLDELAEAHNVY